MLTRSLLAALAALALAPVAAAQDPNYTRTEDIIYGRKFGLAMTMDVFAPKDKEKSNGKGIIWCVSGGWVSAKPGGIGPGQEFVNRGYTVFAVVHGSQPKFTIPEVLEDMHRAVRFIRANVGAFHICLWTFTMTEAWAWTRDEKEMAGRSASPWGPGAAAEPRGQAAGVAAGTAGN